MSVQLKIDTIFNLLIYNLNRERKDFIELCKKAGMVSTKCIPDVGQYSQLPTFSKRECFTFQIQNAHNVLFEVISDKDVILQAGVNIYFDKVFTKIHKEVFEQGKKLLEDRFGQGIFEGTTQTPIYNYGDEILLGYISITTADFVGINMKVGSAKIWNKYYPINQIKGDFLRFIRQLKPDDWNVRVNDRWTVKDVVAHMVGWEAIDPAEIRKARETKKRPWFYETEDYEEFNQASLDKYHQFTSEQLIKEMERCQMLVQQEVGLLGEDSLRREPQLFGWLFERDEDPGGHYGHHLRQIKQALKK